jgi:penicillin-binding protein 2
MDYWRKKRLVVAFCLILIAFFLLILHLGVIQLGKGKYYTALALRRETVTVSLEDFCRGRILDSQLRPLTQSYRVNRVVALPQAVTLPEETAQKLAGILGVNQKELEAAIKKPQVLPYELSPGQAQAIWEEKMPGILVVPLEMRYGPEPLAVQTVGYLGRVNPGGELASLNAKHEKEYMLGDWVGRAGLEYFYESELKGGRPQKYARLHIDGRGAWLEGLGIEVNLKDYDTQRQDVVTTLDADIQRIVEEEMDASLENGAVVVMDVSNGDILAMASRPRYNPDPEKLSQYLNKAPEAFLDQGVGLFAPGSLFKVVVAAAAISEGIVTPSDTFTCLGEKDQCVRCWYGPGHGVLDFTRAFAHSCNPVFAKVALELGAEKLIAYAHLFGLDEQQITGYPVPVDQRQNLSLIAGTYNLVNSSLGQGPVLVTPVQMAAMMNTVVNDGICLTPRLVRELRTEDGKITREFPSPPGRRAISAEVARTLREMLLKVTIEGVGKEAYLPGCGSAGKTGSAQAGGNQINAWFCGYAPVASPRYVVVVMAKNGESGGKTAAPIFKKITEKILQVKGFNAEKTKL